MNQRPSLDVNVAYVEGQDDTERGTSSQPLTQNFFTMSSGKRKHDELASQHNSGGHIPQQDGAGDAASAVFQNVVYGGGISFDARHTSSNGKTSAHSIYNYGGVFSEDYNIANTPAPPEVPAPIAQNEVDDGDVGDDEPPLNDDLDYLKQGEDQNTHNLVLAQFDKLTRTKSRWTCTLKDGIMHINDKGVLISKATGEFDF